MLNITTLDVQGFVKNGVVFDEQDIQNLIHLFQLEQILGCLGFLNETQKKEYKYLAGELEDIAELDKLIIVI